MSVETVNDSIPQTEKRDIFAWVIYLLLFVCVMVSAVMVVLQVFHYRQDYKQMTQLYRDKDELSAERGRLLIEQQTFGATAQIGARAVTILRMYSPPVQQTVVIQLPTQQH